MRNHHGRRQGEDLDRRMQTIDEYDFFLLEKKYKLRGNEKKKILTTTYKY